MDKLITIIIATYNAEQTLKKCLDSIAHQKISDIELILVDGGSIDKTNEIINSYKGLVDIHISEPDKGVYDAWNKGIRLAKGNWIMFIGADDILLPNAINTYLNIIKETKDIDSYDYICAHNEYVDYNNKLLKVIGGEPKWSIMRRTMAAAHVGSLHNRHNLFETIGNYDLQFKICADYELLMRKKNTLKYLFIPNTIAQMKIGGMSFSTKAIIEAYNIRKLHNSIPYFINICLFIRDWLAFKFFIFRKVIIGRKSKKLDE